jgi:tetratricopeptide (TPR) repeat protein
MRKRAAFLLLLTCLTLMPRAHGQEATLLRNREAVTRGESGLQAFRSGAWERAYAEFHAAESLSHSPVFLLYMARSRARQGAGEEALDLYHRVASEPLSDDTPEAWKAAVASAFAERKALEQRMHAHQRLHAPASAPHAAAPAHRRPPRKPRPPRSELASLPGAPVAQSRRHAALASAAIGAAGAVLGVVAGIRAWTEIDALKRRCEGKQCRPADRQRLDDVQLWARVSDVGFVVFGTGLAASAVCLWAVPDTEPNPGRRGSSAGILTRVRF